MINDHGTTKYICKLLDGAIGRKEGRKEGRAPRKETNLKNLSINVNLSTIGHDLNNKVVQKLTLEKIAYNKKCSPKLIFSIDFSIQLIFDIKN